MKIWLPLILTLAAVPAWCQQGRDDDKGVEQLMSDANKDIKQLAQDAQSRVIDADHEAVDLVHHVSRSAPAAGNLLSSAAGYGDLAPQCHPQGMSKSRATIATQRWPDMTSGAQQRHNQAAQALNGFRGRIQKIDEELQRAEKIMREVEKTLDEAGAIEPAPSQPQLLPVKSDVEGRYRATDDDRRADRRKLDALKKRWEKFKQALEGGAVKQFDDNAGRLVDSGQQFAAQAQTLVSLPSPCTPGGSAQFGQSGSQISGGASRLDRGDEGESGAKSAVQQAQKEPD